MQFEGTVLRENESAAEERIPFYLQEKEPIRIIQDKLPIRRMRHETTFGPTKKRLLKVPHVTLDNRRKYLIRCAQGYEPIVEIWKMSAVNQFESVVYSSLRPVTEQTVQTPVLGLDVSTVPNPVEIKIVNEDAENALTGLDRFTTYWGGSLNIPVTMNSSTFTATLTMVECYLTV
jgi:hypothetical protein